MVSLTDINIFWLAIAMTVRIRLAAMLGLIPLLLSCGGGGGGSGTNPYVLPDAPRVPFHTPKRVDTFVPYASPSTNPYVSDIFVRDLNNDTVDEVVVGGRMTAQPNVTTHRQSDLQIYGWNTGTFRRETSTWFAGNDNRILGTEPAIRFGDFNGDGRPDMVVSPGTDMQLYGPAAVFINQGGRFARQDIAIGNVWSHDATVADFDGDGTSDILITDYNQRPALIMGSRTGALRTYVSNSSQPGGSGVSVADFMGNGTRTIIKTDSGRTGLSDTHLYSWSVASGSLVLSQIAALPQSRFYLPKWDAVRSANPNLAPHEIRNLAHDFNRDGRPDVIVFSTMPKGNNAHGYSEVQFLRNDGSGQFTDVTDSVLRNYSTNRTSSYQPQLIDVNNDGLLDIFLSAQDYTGQDSTTVLVATREGVFVEQYTSVFRAFHDQVKNMAGMPGAASEAIAIVRGPNNVNYLVTSLQFDQNGDRVSAMYLAEIGSFGTVTAQASVATLQTAWPWMSAAQANEVLSRTARSYIDGLLVIDMAAALNPVGGLGIALDGRTSERRPITGGIFVPGLDSNILNGVAAVDGLSRDFRVDMRGLAGKPLAAPIQYSRVDRPGDTWASRFVGLPVQEQQGFSAAGDGMNWTTGMNTRALGWNRPYVLSVSVTQIQGSPWFGFSGVFGSVSSSVILDTTMLRHWSNGTWVQAGIMQTSTTFTPGLITKVDPVWSAYGIAGWQNDTWSLHAGLQPTVFAGSMDLKLPSHVDQQGTMHYSTSKVAIRSDQVYFVGGGPRWRAQQHHFSIDATANTVGRYQVMARYRLAL